MSDAAPTLPSPPADGKPIPVVIKRRKRRWWLRIPVILICLVLTIVVLVQALLWSDYPRQIAEAQIQQILGVKAAIKSVRIGWLGDTRVQGLRLTLPTASEPFLTVEDVAVHHTSLPLIAFSQDIESVRVTGVRGDLIQQPDGRWNVQQLLGSSQGPTTKNTQSSSSRTLELPDIDVSDVAVKITKNDGKTVTVDQLTLTGKHTGPLSYDLAGAAGDYATITGNMALAGALDHHALISIKRVPTELQAFAGAALPDPLHTDIDWTGRRTPSGVTGNVKLADTVVGPGHITVMAGVSTNDAGDLVIEPQYASYRPGEKADVDAVIKNGRITIGSSLIVIDDLRGLAQGGRVAVDGSFDPKTFTGSALAAWDAIEQSDVKTTGTAEIKTEREFTGKLKATATLTGTADTVDGRAQGALTVVAIAEAAANITATLDTQPFTWSPAEGEPIAVPALVGALALKGNQATLLSLKPRDPAAGELLAAGRFDLDNRQWWATLDTTKLRIPRLEAEGVKDPINLHFDAFGTLERVTVKQLFLGVGRTTIYGKGFYIANDPSPLRLDTWAWYDPHLDPGDDRVGVLQARGVVAGTLVPRKLTAKGLVDATALVVRGRQIGDVSIDVEAGLTDRRATLVSREIELFGGNWTLSGNWTAFSKKPPTVIAKWRNVPLARLADLAGQENIEGLIDAGEVTIIIPSADPKAIEAVAVITGQHLKRYPAEVETLRIDATLKNGVLTARPVLTQGAGKISVDASYDLLTPASPLTAKVMIDQWPAPTLITTGPAADLKADFSGSIDATLVPSTAALDADMRLTGKIDREAGNVGSFEMAANAQNRRVTLSSFRLKTLDGSARAAGGVDLANPESIRLNATFEKLAPSELAWFNPALADVRGRFSGALDIAPAAGPRPLGPVEIDFAMTADNGRFRTIDLGPVSFVAYAAYTSPEEFRVVTEQAAIALADGEIRPFARLSATPDQGLSQLITATLDDLDIGPIQRAFKDDGHPVAGRLSGDVKAVGRTGSVGTITAEASLRLSKANLINYKPIAAILAGRGNDKELTGSGMIAARIEQGVLTLNDVDYYQNPLNITAIGDIRGLEKALDAANDFLVVGTVRPLREMKLPFFEDADSVLSAFQGSATAIHVGGTLGDPKPVPAALAELGDTLNKILLGKAKQGQTK